MTLNDLLTKQNVITKINLKEDNKEVSKELKVKIMRIRMAYSKIKNNFDSEVKEFSEELTKPKIEELNRLNEKIEKTPEEIKRLKELTDSINSEYQEFLIQKGNEEVVCIDDSFTISEYEDILEVNAGNDIEINGNKILATDFLEIFYNLFVKED